MNECHTGNHDCHVKASCSNTKGSYTCTCDGGWHGDGRKCSGNSFKLTFIMLHYSFQSNREQLHQNMLVKCSRLKSNNQTERKNKLFEILHLLSFEQNSNINTFKVSYSSKPDRSNEPTRFVMTMSHRNLNRRSAIADSQASGL